MQIQNYNMQNAQTNPSFSGVRNIKISGFSVEDQVPILRELKEYDEFKKFVDKYDVDIDIFKGDENDSNLVIKVLGNPLGIPENMSTKAKEIIDAICKKYGDIELAVNFPKDLSLKKMYDYLTSPDSILVREKLVWEAPCFKVDDIYEREYEYFETLRKDIKKLEKKINNAQKEISDNDPEKIALREEQKRLEMEKKKLEEQARQEELAKERNSLLDKILNMGRKIIG